MQYNLFLQSSFTAFDNRLERGKTIHLTLYIIVYYITFEEVLSFFYQAEI